MVRNYVKKGGHGGSRGGGLPHGYWDDQGGRAAAGIAKAQSKAKAAADKKNAVERASERWQKMVGTSEKTQNAPCEQLAAAELRRSPRKAAASSSSNDAPPPSHANPVAQPAIRITNEMMMAMNTASFAAFAAQRGQ